MGLPQCRCLVAVAGGRSHIEHCQAYDAGPHGGDGDGSLGVHRVSGLIYEVDGFHRAREAVFAPIGVAVGAVMLPAGWDGAIWLALPVLALAAGIAFYAGCWRPHTG